MFAITTMREKHILERATEIQKRKLGGTPHFSEIIKQQRMEFVFQIEACIP